jgi:hypothetical protein
MFNDVSGNQTIIIDHRVSINIPPLSVVLFVVLSVVLGTIGCCVVIAFK